MIHHMMPEDWDNRPYPKVKLPHPSTMDHTDLNTWVLRLPKEVGVSYQPARWMIWWHSTEADLLDAEYLLIWKADQHRMRWTEQQDTEGTMLTDANELQGMNWCLI